MSDFELNIKVCNRLLNKIMKRDYGYDYSFRINPIIYIDNRSLIPKKVHLSEMVYVKLKSSITFDEREKIRKDLNKNINLLFTIIEGREYRPILDIKLKLKQ
jgi:hypothetical protein